MRNRMQLRSQDASLRVRPKVPSFIGETVKNVMQEATENGIDVDMLGEGLAREQNPAPGAVLNPGEHIRVRFAR